MVRRKADSSPVTDADLAAEAVLVEGLRRRWPSDAIQSEEGTTRGGSGHTWYVDPIDGTSAYTEGLAHWGPAVARVAADGSVPLGAVWLPRLREMTLIEGGRAWADGVRLAPFAEVEPARVVYLPSAFSQRHRLDFRAKARCLGGTAAHLARLARGSAVGVVVAPSWRVWDTAAGLALIQALGGRTVRLPDGAPIDLLRDEGQPFVAGFAGVVDELARAIDPAPRGAPHAAP